MNKKILAAALLSVFAFSVVVTGASAETRAEKRVREAAKKVEKKVEKKAVNKMATTTNATSTSSASTSSSSTPSSDGLACVKSVVDKRESGIISNQSAFNSTAQTALETRRNRLSDAWSISDNKERKSAVKSAWNNFKTSSKSARKTLQDGNKSAWSTFETSRKACKDGDKTQGVSEENEGKGIDISS